MASLRQNRPWWRLCMWCIISDAALNLPNEIQQSIKHFLLLTVVEMDSLSLTYS